MAKKPSKSVGSSIASRLTKFADQVEKSAHPARDFSRARFTARNAAVVSPPAITGVRLQALRARLGVSQAVFAKWAGVSLTALRDWEQGVRAARGPALRLFEQMQSDPEYWAQRMGAVLSGKQTIVAAAAAPKPAKKLARRKPTASR